jgi:sugar phosphate isomerase/epimerase|tara:strand:- start:2827 stop:3603 length:777 start_codon:yes stop_codon:yes gene_type:complete
MKKMINVSFQLYSARSNNSWKDVISLLAELGYNQVEGFDSNFENPNEFRSNLSKYNMTMPSGHFYPLSSLEEDFEASVSISKKLGIEQIFCAAPDDYLCDSIDHNEWIKFSQRLNNVCKKLNDNGIKFGWHNHNWEFMNLKNGSTGMNLILEHAPLIDWEIDIAWLIRGGQNPLKWIDNFQERISAAHIKDIAQKGECEDEDGWADVGYGTISWEPIMSSLLSADVELYVMEHDKPNDIKRFATRSIEAFKKMRELYE